MVRLRGSNGTVLDALARGEFLSLILVKGVISDRYFVDMVIGSYNRSITSGDLTNQ